MKSKSLLVILVVFSLLAPLKAAAVSLTRYDLSELPYEYPAFEFFGYAIVQNDPIAEWRYGDGWAEIWLTFTVDFFSVTFDSGFTYNSDGLIQFYDYYTDELTPGTLSRRSSEDWWRMGEYAPGISGFGPIDIRTHKQTAAHWMGH